MASTNTRLNIKKLNGNIVQKHGGSTQVGFKQLGPGVETGVHDEKRVWFEVELQGAQGDRKAKSGLSKVFWAKDTTRSTYLANRNIGFNESGKYKKTFIGYGVCTGSMQVLHGFEFEVESLGDHTFEVEPQENIYQGAGLKEVQTQNLMDYQLACDREQHLACELFGYKEDSNEAAFTVAIVEKIYANKSLTFNNTIACKEYHMVYTILDIASTDVGMLDKFDRGLQTDVHVFVDFDYAMGRSIIFMDVDEEDLDLSERNLKLCKRNIYDDHYTTIVRVLSSSGIAPYNDATLKELKAKHPFKSAPSLPDIPIDHHRLIASKAVVLNKIKNAVAISHDLVSSITQVENLFLDGKCPMMLGEYIASAPLTPMVKPGGSIHSIAVGGEAILHVVNHLIDDRGDDVGLSMLLVDFKNAFNLVDQKVMLEEVCRRCPAISHWVNLCYSSPARLYYREYTLWSCQGMQRGDPLGPLLFSLVLHPLIWKMLELIMEDGQRCGLHLNVDKNEIFWPKEDPISMFEGVFSPNISRSLHGVKLIGGPVSVDFDFSSELVMKRVSKTIRLMDAVANINDPQCELLLLHACAERIVTASRPGFGDSQWRLATLPFAFGGLGIYSASDALTYAFLTSRLRSPALQTKLLRHVGIVTFGSTFDDALCIFNTSMEFDLLSNPSEIVSPKLMKKMVGIYFTRVLKMQNLHFPYLLDIWPYGNLKWRITLRNWLMSVPIFGLGQTMNVGKVVDIGLDEGCDKPLRPTYMLLYSWDGGLDVCVDLIGSLPLTQTGMADFVSGRAVIDVEQCKRVKYMAKYAAIVYGFLSFSFPSLGELDKDAVTLLKQIQKFPMAQDIGARAA
nr:hypothetical protein [Tanacetum cinerariifolium]